MTWYDNNTRNSQFRPSHCNDISSNMEKLRQGQNIAISQFHNTIPFYNGDFQFLETNLNKLEKINENDFDTDYDYKAGQFGEQNKLKTRNNLGELKQMTPPFEVISLVKTHWNRKFKTDSDSRRPYRGYQLPEEIDWSRYGPDRPGKGRAVTARYPTFTFNIIL